MKNILGSKPLRIALNLTLTLATLIFIGACASSDKAGEPGGSNQMLPKGSTSNPYLLVLEPFSAGEAEYDGLYNQFTYRATLVNSPVREALLLKEAEYFKWDPQQLFDAKAKAQEKMATSTEVFMSFFTPERQNDNLTDSKSIWRVYLDLNGKRYEGVPRKARKAFAEIQALYPYHTRWNTPYLVDFPVPTLQAQGGVATYIVTGPLGAQEIKIPAVE